MTRRGQPALAMAMLGGLVSACTSGTGTAPSASSGATAGPSSIPVASASSPATPTTTVTRTVPASSQSPGSSQPSGSSSPTGGGAPGTCTSSDLAISSSGGNGASERNRYVLYFRNTSSATCILHGYPGVDALAASGSLIVHARRTEHGFLGGSRRGVPTVPVAPGQSASAIVEWLDIQPGTGEGCYKVSATIAVTAANTTRAVHINRSVTGCDLQVHPTVPGRTGALA